MIEYQCTECYEMSYTSSKIEHHYFPNCRCGGELEEIIEEITNPRMNVGSVLLYPTHKLRRIK